MVLPEVVCRLIPIGAVIHLIAGGDIVAIGILGKIAVCIIGQILIERVILTESNLVHILIGLDTCVYAISAIHQTHIVVASRHAIPSLTCLLEVTDVLITDLEVVTQPSQTTVITATTTTSAMDKAIGIRFMIGTVEDQVFP